MPTLRPVVRVVTAQATSDGAGVRLERSLGTPALDYLDPFLMLDEFKSDQRDDYIAGFPDHPHRGFETVTYMLAGHMLHQDHKGNRGNLGPGSVQWMTAGRGIVHSEMPQQEDGLMWGFQLWVNLPAAQKMCEPRYQDIPGEAVPEVQVGDARVRVIAGSFNGTDGAVRDIVTQPLYLDVALEAGGRCEIAVPSEHTAFAYVFAGEGHFAIGAESIGRGRLVVFGSGDRIEARADSEKFRFLLLAGAPLREPVARYGPFVMNTRDEIIQAFRDFESGRLQA